MIKSLVITPPILGWISIGKVIRKIDMRLPGKEGQFAIAGQNQCN